jgi:outer membrane lipoprotein-sorting protein
MSHADNIRKLFEKLHTPTSAELDGKIYAEISRASAGTQENKPALPVIWRIIMKSNITKIAAAVVLIALVLFGFALVEKTTTPAYAVEQTIEAMRKVTTAHCFMKLSTGQKMEIWVKVNPKTGDTESYYMSMPGATTIATPEGTYVYDEVRNKNVVIHLKGDGHVVSNVHFGRIIEDMVKLAESRNGKIEFKQITIEKEKPAILVTIETNTDIMETVVDLYTKLPISMNFKPKGELQSEQFAQNIEDFTFNAPLPEGIFEFKIPEGAQVIEQ